MDKQDMLLTDEEIISALAKNIFHAKELLPSFEYDVVIAEAQLAKVKQHYEQEVEELLKEIDSELWKIRQMFDYDGKPTDDESKCTLSNLMITSQRWAGFKHSLKEKYLRGGK